MGDSMKISILYLSFALLACLGLAGTLSTRAFGQVSLSVTSADEGCHWGDGTGTGSIESPIPENMRHVPSGGDAKPPADWNPPDTEENLRFWGFFGELRGWDKIAKCYEDKGDAGWADHFRTKLERESGLTSSEAAEVKRIVFQYFQDDQNAENQMSEIRSRAIADYPNSWKSVIYSDPEYIALHKQKSNLLNQTIAQLVSTLGSRPFTKLDLYTRHYKDRMKAAQEPRKAEGVTPQ